MAKNVLQSTILSANGGVSVAPGASIEIRNAASGQLVPLWLDRDGTQPTSNPFTTDSSGFFRVYLDAGRYHITASKDGQSQEWRDVQLGSAAGYDVDDMLAALAAGVYTSVAAGLANTAEGDFFWVAHQAGDDVLTLYRVVDGDAELWAALPRGDVVRELTDRAEDAAEAAEASALAAQGSAMQAASSAELAGQSAGAAASSAMHAEAEADRSDAAASAASDLVAAATAGFQGFVDGMGYDFGRITQSMTYFNRDFGRITDPA